MPERILALRPRAMGDVVLTTPALRSLKRGHPGAELHVVTDPRYAPLLEGLPEIDRVLPLDRDAGSTARLIAGLRRARWMLAVDFFGNPRSAFITALSGAAVTAGYDLRGRRYAYRVRVPRNPPPGSPRREYAAATHLRLAAVVGGVTDGEDARVSVSPASRAEAERLLAGLGLQDPRGAVGLVAAGTWGPKTWPLSHAAVLARRLIRQGYAVLVISGPGEDPVRGRLIDLVPEARALPACGVGVLAAVISRLGAVVGTDSGPRHLAIALGVPTFAWFGPTHPENWTPEGELHGLWWTDVPCRGCGRTSCPHWTCLPALDPERAAVLVLGHLERHGRHGRSTSDLGSAARA